MGFGHDLTCVEVGVGSPNQEPKFEVSGAVSLIKYGQIRAVDDN